MANIGIVSRPTPQSAELKQKLGALGHRVTDLGSNPVEIPQGLHCVVCRAGAAAPKAYTTCVKTRQEGKIKVIFQDDPARAVASIRGLFQDGPAVSEEAEAAPPEPPEAVEEPDVAPAPTPPPPTPPGPPPEVRPVSDDEILEAIRKSLVSVVAAMPECGITEIHIVGRRIEFERKRVVAGTINLE